MKKELLAALAMSVTFAACGGGGGGSSSPGGGPVVTPTLQPTTYKVHVTFAGGTSLRTTQSLTRTQGGLTVKGYRLHPLDTSSSTQLPVEMAIQPVNANDEESFDHGSDQGTATVVVQPEPSAPPAVSLAPSGIDLTTQSAPVSPNAAGPQFLVSHGYTTPQAGTLIATVSGSASATVTVPAYIIERTVISCGNRPVYGNDGTNIHPEDQAGAVQFVGGVAQAVTDTTQADIYMDGPNCTTTGTQNSAESVSTIHFPLGAVCQSSVTQPFSTLSALSWSNTLTSETYHDLVAGATAATNPCDELLVQTHEGKPAKLALTSMSELGTDLQVLINYDYAESGSSVDGF